MPFPASGEMTPPPFTNALKRDYSDSYCSEQDSLLLTSRASFSFNSTDVEEAFSYTDRGWNSVWQEVIGRQEVVPSNDFLDNVDTLETDLLLPPIGDIEDVEGNIELWMRQQVPDLDIGNGGIVAHSESELHVPDQTQPNFDMCYGMIYRANAKLQGDMSNVLKRLADRTVPLVHSHYYLTDVSCSESGQLFIIVPGGLRVAQLNQHLSESLHSLLESRTISAHGLIHRKTILEDVSSAVNAKDAQTRVNINVYGSSSVSSSVGKHLSAQKVWLQRPDWWPQDCTYSNPHFLQIPGHHNDDAQSSAGAIESGTNGVDFKESIDEVYTMLTRDAHLKGISGDAKLRTALLPHQEKALDFMTQREFGPIDEEYRLWYPVGHGEDIWYHHKVANIKTKTLPQETGGGILADEMGMGKTFSTLALIVRSLADAVKWSTDPNTRLTDEVSPSKLLSRATLVVVPSPLLLTTWTNELADRLDMQLKVLVHHGIGRPTAAEQIVDYDIVLTTYHSLVFDQNRGHKPIENIAWFRVVLDEAHFIRTPTTLLHKRVSELQAKNRWCLTGTPIQNRLEDAGALLMFLRIEPFDRLNIFRQYVTVPFSEGGRSKMSGQQSLAKLLDAFCVRRTKDLLNLSNFIETTHHVSFSDDERLQYTKMKDDMNRAIRNILSDSESRSRFGMFQAQLQLRLVCNHGTFQHPFHWARARNLSYMADLDMREDALTLAGRDGISCSSCKQWIPAGEVDRAYDMQPLCTHLICSQCRDDNDADCPLCRATAFSQKHDRGTRHAHSRMSIENYFRRDGYSSKMEALIQDLQQLHPSDKSIVFSQWTTTLNLVELHLRRRGMTYDRIDGNDDFKHRQKVLDSFRNQPELTILLMTTGVGAFGLDLIAANHVFLCEPLWNPSVELQAIGRTLRIGQNRSVTVTRYIVLDTVEKDMQQLQRRKLNMAGMVNVNDSMDEADTSSQIDPDKPNAHVKFKLQRPSRDAKLFQHKLIGC